MPVSFSSSRAQTRAEAAEPFGRRGVAFGDQRHLAAHRDRAFGHDDDAEARAEFLALLQAFGDDVQIERNLRNQNHVRAAGHAGIERDPPGIAAHHFDDHHAVVRLRRAVKPIDGIGRKIDGRVEPEQLTVPTMSLSMVFGTPTIGMPCLTKLMRDAERAVSADDDERVETELVEILDDARRVVDFAVAAVSTGYANGLPRLVVPRMVPPRRRMPVTSFGPSDARAPWLDETVEAVFDAEHLDAGVAGRLHDRPDDRVQSRARHRRP